MPESRIPYKIISSIITISFLVFIIKSFILLPVPQRGIAGSNFYPIINEWQFIETAIFTIIASFIVCKRVFYLNIYSTLWLIIGSVLFNFGLMLIDARFAAYDYNIESLIKNNYGNVFEIHVTGFASILFGIAVIVATAINGCNNDKHQ